MAAHVASEAAPRPAASDRLISYASERREMIRYPEVQATGWQIGSGPTEASCKTMTSRLKRSGMRWDADNAEAIMAVESLSQSGQWDQYLEVSTVPNRLMAVDLANPSANKSTHFHMLCSRCFTRRLQSSPSPTRTAVEAWVSAQGSGTEIDPLTIPNSIELPDRSVSKLVGEGAIVIVAGPPCGEVLTE
jgi:hypothetical protein